MEHKIDAIVRLSTLSHQELARIADTLDQMNKEHKLLVAAATGKGHVPFPIVMAIVAALIANLLIDKLTSRHVDLSYQSPKTKLEITNPK